MDIERKQDTSRPFTGKHMLLIMGAFFGVIISVNFFMATLASGTWTGLVVKNSYVASQKFNIELEEAKAQKASGIRSDLHYRDATLVFTLKNHEGIVIRPTDLVAKIGRPAFEQKDQILEFKPCAEDCQVLNVDLNPGYWSIRITGQYNGANYRRDVRLFVDSDGNGRVE